MCQNSIWALYVIAKIIFGLCKYVPKQHLGFIKQVPKQYLGFVGFYKNIAMQQQAFRDVMQQRALGCRVATSFKVPCSNGLQSTVQQRALGCHVTTGFRVPRNNGLQKRVLLGLLSFAHKVNDFGLFCGGNIILWPNFGRT